MRLASIGLLVVSLVVFGCTPPAPAPTEPVKPAGGAAPTTGTTGAMDLQNREGVRLVSMKVDMHCPHGCYPTVKKTLEELAGVESVTLAEQKAADVIDNPKVYIKLNGEFDIKNAIAALEKEGYKSEAID